MIGQTVPQLVEPVRPGCLQRQVCKSRLAGRGKARARSTTRAGRITVSRSARSGGEAILARFQRGRTAGEDGSNRKSRLDSIWAPGVGCAVPIPARDLVESNEPHVGEAYAAAMGGQWRDLIDVGDAALRIGEIRDFGESMPKCQSREG
jgi:hypothetical protein